MAKVARGSRGGAKPGERRGGRSKGTPNKATREARAAIALFVDSNADRLQSWLDDVAADSPEKAFGLFLQLVEFHVPKLARTELTGKDGGAIAHKVESVEWRIVSPEA